MGTLLSFFNSSLKAKSQIKIGGIVNIKIMGPFDKSDSHIPTKKLYNHLEPDSLLIASQKESMTNIID